MMNNLRSRSDTTVELTLDEVMGGRFQVHAVLKCNGTEHVLYNNIFDVESAAKDKYIELAWTWGTTDVL